MISKSQDNPNASVPDISELKQRYVANLAALYVVFPEVAAAVDTLPFADCPHLHPTRDGNLTVQLTADDGKQLFAHSKYRPVEEARKLVETLPETDTPNFFVCGIGLGYHITALEERFEAPFIIVFEDDISLIKTAMCVTDFTKILNDRHFGIITTADKGKAYGIFESITSSLIHGVQYVAPTLSSRYHSEFHRDMRSLVGDFMQFYRTQMITVLKNARITFKNVLHNMGAYIASPGIEEIKGVAKGYPAIVIAAGPSLARNIHQLSQYHDKAVIIGVQTVFKSLLERNTPPHFVTSLDYHEISERFFQGVEDAKGTTLVAEAKATWHVVDIFPGQKRVTNHNLITRLLKREPRFMKGDLKGGSTVAHLSFYLAQYLGCDPIIFLGQDLSFTEAMYYSPGTPIEKIWYPEFDRFSTVEMKQWERIVRHKRILRETVDIHGRTAYSDNQMFTYAEQFVASFESAPQRIIQASEGGRALKGMEVMTFAEAASQFCTKPLPNDLFATKKQTNVRADFEEALANMESRSDELKKMKAISMETIELLEKLQTLTDRPKDFNRTVARIDDLRSHMRQFDDMYDVVTNVSPNAELRRQKADRRIGEQEHETAEVAQRRLQRDCEYVRSFIEGCNYVEGILPDIIARLREQMP